MDIKKYQKEFGTKEIVNWNNTKIWKWEFELLKDEGAINDNAILAEYPKVAVCDKYGKERTEDYGGVITTINEKVEKLQKAGYHSYILYVPKKYTEFLQAKEQLDKYNKAISYAGGNI